MENSIKSIVMVMEMNTSGTIAETTIYKKEELKAFFDTTAEVYPYSGYEMHIG